MARYKDNPEVPDINKWVQPAKLALIKAFRMDGASMEEVAKYIGVSRSTLYYWQARDERIKNALKLGKLEAVALVENKFFDNACTSNSTKDQVRWLKYNKRDKYFDELPREYASQDSNQQLNNLLDKIGNALFETLDEDFTTKGMKTDFKEHE